MNAIQPHPDYSPNDAGVMCHDYLNKRLPAATYLIRCSFIAPFEGVVEQVMVRAATAYAARCEARRLRPDLPHRIHLHLIYDSREEGLGPEVF